MKSIGVYHCLCDETRLRILNLLLEGPLCVCHLTTILKLDQPKISRHLKALKEAGAVETERCYNWTIYRLGGERNRVLETNLKCLQDLRGEEAVFRRDLKRRQATITAIRSGKNSGLPARIRCLAEGKC